MDNHEMNGLGNNGDYNEPSLDDVTVTPVQEETVEVGDSTEENENRSYNTSYSDANSTSYSAAYNGSNYNSYNNPYQEQKGPQDGLKACAIVSLVFGILSLVCCCTVGPSLIFGIVAVICGVICLPKQTQSRGLAIGGFVCGIIGIVLSILVIIFGVIMAKTETSDRDNFYFYEELENDVFDEL